MSFFNATENSFLALLFNATPWANVADNAASSPLTDIVTALHTADPGEAGNLSTSEATYTPYGRQSKARTSGGWTVDTVNNRVNPVSNIVFPLATAGVETLRFASVGKTGAGAAVGFLYGALAPVIDVTAGVTPQLTTASYIGLD